MYATHVWVKYNVWDIWRNQLTCWEWWRSWRLWRRRVDLHKASNSSIVTLLLFTEIERIGLLAEVRWKSWIWPPVVERPLLIKTSVCCPTLAAAVGSIWYSVMRISRKSIDNEDLAANKPTLRVAIVGGSSGSARGLEFWNILIPPLDWRKKTTSEVPVSVAVEYIPSSWWWAAVGSEVN